MYVCAILSSVGRYLSEFLAKWNDRQRSGLSSVIETRLGRLCSAISKGGRLFLFEAPPRTATSAPSSQETGFRESEIRSGEYFWLCEECAKSMTITSDENGRAFVAAYEQRYLKRMSRS